MKKKIAVFLFNGFSDWEIAYFTPEIRKNKNFELLFFSFNASPVLSMGGLHVLPDTSLQNIDPDEIEMLVLPGGTLWEKDENSFIDPLIKDLMTRKKTIAAICGATIYLAKKGYLNQVKHTSSDLFYLKSIAPEYTGEDNYVNSLAVTGENIITANGIAPIEFAREIFLKLNMLDTNSIEKWYQLFKNGIWSE